MPIFWIRRPRKKVVGRGYLFCPSCFRRTPGEMYIESQIVYLYGFIPLGSERESKNYLTCDRCEGTFAEEGDWAFDFGDHAEPRKWECRRCGETENTSERMTCKRCGKRV